MSSHHQPPATIYHTLKPHALSGEAYAPFKPVEILIARLLGQPPAPEPLTAISRSAIYNHIVLIRSSMTVPTADLALSSFTPSLRRAIFFTATYNFDCAYCTAHACVSGDVLRGSLDQQIRRGASVPLFTTDLNHPHLPADQRAAMKLAKAASSRKNLPSTTQLRALVRDLRTEIAEDGVEAVKACICISGFLNTFMDTLGAELENGISHFARTVFEEAGVRYEEGIHKTDDAFEEPESQGTIAGMAANVMRLLGSLPSVMRCLAMEREALDGLPRSAEALERWADQNIGYVPAFVRNIRSLELKRVACFSVRHNLLSDGEEKYYKGRVWRLEERGALLYTFGKEVGCDELMEMAVRVAKVERGELDAVTDGTAQGRWSEGVKAAREVIVRQVAAPQNVTGEVVERLTSVCQPEAVMELVGMIGWFCYCYRMVTLFGDEE